MEKSHEKILDDFKSDLKRTINLSCLLPHLVRRKLLTSKEEQELKNQTKTAHDANSEFLDILKTKGSRAFSLFLETLRDEDEHMGHDDLFKKLSAADCNDQETFNMLVASQQPPDGIRHSASEPGTRHESKEVSPSHSPKTKSRSHGKTKSYRRISSTSELGTQSTAIEKCLESITQRLVQLEKAVNDNRFELDRLNNTYQRLLTTVSARNVRPDSRDSITGSSGAEADCESGGSETSLMQTSRSRRKPWTKKKPTMSTVESQSELESVHSAYEETSATGINDTTSEMTWTLPPILSATPSYKASYSAPLPLKSGSHPSFHSEKLLMPPHVMLDNKASDSHTLQLNPIHIIVPCTCQESYFPPVIFDGHVNFIYWEAKEHQRISHSSSSVQEYIQSYDLTKCQWLKKKRITGIKQCVCCVFPYSKRITLFGGDFHAGTFKVGLYQLPDDSTYSFSWKIISNSKWTLLNLDPNNCICVQYENKVVVVTVVIKRSKQTLSSRILFHMYSPGSDDEIYWKSSFLSISPSNLTCHIQSCVIVSGIAYYVLQYDNVAHIYEVNLAPLCSSSSSQCNLPPSINLKTDSTAVKCFLSVVDMEIIVISVKSTDNRSYIEIKPLKSSPLLPYTYHFQSTVEVVTATVVPDTNNSVAIVYHDPKAGSCNLKIVNIEYGD